MATLDPRQSTVIPNVMVPNNVPPRRATVSSPQPSFAFSNSFESHRPRSRTDRFYDRPYPYRRSTVSGHSQGHNVNHAPQLTLHADDTTMWSDSTSSSPIMNTVVLTDTSPAPSSSSCNSPRLTHATYDFAFPQMHSPMTSSFTLCPSPDVPTPMDHPRSMPPPSLLAANFHSAVRPATSPAHFTLSHEHAPPHPHPSAPAPSPPPPHTLSRQDLDDELSHLRDRVRHLEFINDLVRLRVAELESDSKSRIHADLGLVSDGISATATSDTPYPSNSSTPAPGAPGAPNDPLDATSTFSFLHNLGSLPPDWDARTAARLRRFCALNRAGNALCAWHDSRRERREYPPRMAPPETLNCGCTHSEALFEESLTRNGVGAFHPGENVRMDPALRNPLLRLLEQRYGYRDGDFDRTPEGGWRNGEDARYWEQKAANSGRSSRRADR